MKIYELNKQVEELLDKYYSMFDEDGVQTATDEEVVLVKKEIEELENKKDDLKTWVLQKIQEEKGNIDKIDSEIKRLSELKQSISKQITKGENFAKYLFGDLQKNIVFGNWKIGYRKSSPVKLSDDFNVKEYMKEKITISADKTAIKKDLKAGKEIKGASIEERKNFFIK